MTNRLYILLAFWSLLSYSCTPQPDGNSSASLPIHQDQPFIQDYSVKFYLPDTTIRPYRAYCDRNGVVQVLTSAGLWKLRDGQFLYPGTLVPDGTYRTSLDKQLAGINLYQDQFVYLDNEAILSHAWAGKLFDRHQLPGARILAGGKDFSFLISDGRNLQLWQDRSLRWEMPVQGTDVVDIQYDPLADQFWVLQADALSSFSPEGQDFKQQISGQTFNCFTIAEKGSRIVLGSTGGYQVWDVASRRLGELQARLPLTDIRALAEIGGRLWFGSAQGAFMLREDGDFNYYNGERWLPGSAVQHLAPGPDGSVLVLTDGGLGVIHFKEMTLHEKAMFFEAQVRQRHIRLGFNATLSGMQHGDLATGYLSDSDNDGLWTSMYLGGEIFRYAVTKDPEALQNCRESLDAMERLYTINHVPGFPSRSFERSGYIERLSDPDRWQHSEDPEWDWKATTSSDEAIGHVFVFGAMAELIEDDDLRQRAITLLDTLMQHVIDHDFYLVDYDGKPTTWGRWNPEYVNARPKMVGDRKLNASNIIAMLQTAYYFTQKDIYREKAFELMDQHGYLENLLRPISEITQAPEDADDWSKMLSENWNHSDDEMYFLGYWGLYRYAFNDSLKNQYKAAIIDHWQAERPEKEGAWNLFTAMTGTPDFDLEETIWYLQEYPLDLINWTMTNSHRQDIDPLEPNFREQYTKEVLPPDELRIARHNANRFTLDGGNGGRSENSAGDIWLLPYWLGRYLGVIDGPVR